MNEVNVVAKSSKYHAHDEKGEYHLGDVIEISVNAHSLGIEVRKDAERANDVLIPKNSQLPAAAKL